MMKRIINRVFNELVIVGLIVLLLSIIATLFGSSLAFPHDAPPTKTNSTGMKYPFSCCSGYDCRPVKADWIERNQYGYVIPTTGEVVGYQDKRIRFSDDGEYHWCSKGGKEDTPTICLFVPMNFF